MTLDERVKIFCSLTKESTDDQSVLENKERCIECSKTHGKTCCEMFPCEISPCDLKEINEETIIALLKTGLVTIDKWIGDYYKAGFDEYETIYILRMRAIGETNILRDIYSGKCCVASENGCLLPFHHRPYLARSIKDCMLYANEEIVEYVKKDSFVSTKEQATIMWRPYQDLLKGIVKKIADDNQCDNYLKDVMNSIYGIANCVQVQEFEENCAPLNEDEQFLELYNKSLMRL